MQTACAGLALAGGLTYSTEATGHLAREIEQIPSIFIPRRGASYRGGDGGSSSSVVAIVVDSSLIAPAGNEPEDVWADLTEWHQEAVERVADLSMKRDGWKGPGSLGASRDAVLNAMWLIDKLSMAGVESRPTIGLDDEGVFSFSWIKEGFAAHVSVFGDGTYSFFAKRQDRRVMADEISIDGPLDEGLADILIG